MTFKTIAYLSPIFTSIVLFVILLYQGLAKNRPKNILSLFMLISGIFFISLQINSSDNISISKYSEIVFLVIMVLLHPFFYLYVRSLTAENFTHKFFIMHFVPAILVTLVSIILYLNLTNDQDLLYTQQYKTGIYTGHPELKSLRMILVSAKTIHGLQAIVYFLLSFHLLTKYRKKFKDLFSYDNDLELNWLFIFNFIYIVMSVNGIAINFVPHRIINSNEIILLISLLIFTVFYLFLGMLGIQQKSVMDIIHEYDEETIEKPFQLNYNRILSLIKMYIEIDKAFLNPELRIWDVCKQTHINRTYISKAINEFTGMNFNSYINKLRTDYACQLLKKNKRSLTFDFIAAESGFKSITSFNRAFKQKMKQTPSEFQKSITEAQLV